MIRIVFVAGSEGISLMLGYLIILDIFNYNAAKPNFLSLVTK